MSSLQHINLRPKLTTFLVSSLYFKNEPLTVVDVGARGGLEAYWKVYGDQIRVIGFEPDVRECRRLNRVFKNNQRFYPYALWQSSTKRNFYVMKNAASSSFFKPKDDFWDRFPDRKNLAIRKTLKLNTISLDDFAKKQRIDNIDFIKMDAEGAELAVLKGAVNLLKKSILGLTCEVLFVQTAHNQPVFSEIDLFLKSLGFDLFDLGLYRLGRKTFSKEPGPKKQGQVILGHALFLRDLASEIESGSRRKDPDQIQILKMISIMELFGLYDCAAELVQVAAKYKLLRNSQKDFLKFLNPKKSFFEIF